MREGEDVKDSRHLKQIHQMGSSRQELLPWKVEWTLLFTQRMRDLVLFSFDTNLAEFLMGLYILRRCLSEMLT